MKLKASKILDFFVRILTKNKMFREDKSWN